MPESLKRDSVATRLEEPELESLVRLIRLTISGR
jgi:hypothetical protein